MISATVKRYLIAGVIVLIVVLSLSTVMLYKKTVSIKANNLLLQSNVAAQQAVITKMGYQQRDVAMLDAKHITELANAKTQINSLERSVAAGHQRLLVNANCPSVSSATSSTSLGNGTSAELTAAARSDYFRLRKSIVTVTEQVVTLQDYINTVCLKQPGK